MTVLVSCVSSVSCSLHLDPGDEGSFGVAITHYSLHTSVFPHTFSPELSSCVLHNNVFLFLWQDIKSITEYCLFGVSGFDL